MLLTIPLNPAINLTMQVERLRVNHTNRALSVTFVAGGKDINVSNVLSRFAVETEALVVVNVRGATRVNTVVCDLVRWRGRLSKRPIQIFTGFSYQEPRTDE